MISVLQAIFLGECSESFYKIFVLDFTAVRQKRCDLWCVAEVFDFAAIMMFLFVIHFLLSRFENVNCSYLLLGRCIGGNTHVCDLVRCVVQPAQDVTELVSILPNMKEPQASCKGALVASCTTQEQSCFLQ